MLNEYRVLEIRQKELEDRLLIDLDQLHGVDCFHLCRGDGVKLLAMVSCEDKNVHKIIYKLFIHVLAQW